MPMKKLIWLWAVLCLGVISCGTTEVPAGAVSAADLAELKKYQNALKNDTLKRAILDVMQETYFWNNSIPLTFDATKFETALDVLDALKFKPNDEFSELLPNNIFESRIIQGKASDVGINVAHDERKKLYVAYVLKGSPADLAGVKRGWEILKINSTLIPENYDLKLATANLIGQVGKKFNINFQVAEGTFVSKNMEAAEYKVNPVLYKDDFTVDSTGKKKDISVKVGYLAYQNFIATDGLLPKRSAEVQERMEEFQRKGIQELIIDLRYSFGGEVEVVERLCNYIVPAEHNGKLMYTLKNNSKQTKYDRAVPFGKAGSITLNKVIILTSKQTKGPAEFIMNVMEPYLKVVQIGESTSGMPVGLERIGTTGNSNFSKFNVELLAVKYILTNSTGITNYWDGFPKSFPATPTKKAGYAYVSAPDNPRLDWGNTKDPQFAAAIKYIKTYVPD
jgi:C-terminal processing protease CtpA/Prc